MLKSLINLKESREGIKRKIQKQKEKEIEKS